MNYPCPSLPPTSQPLRSWRHTLFNKKNTLMFVLAIKRRIPKEWEEEGSNKDSLFHYNSICNLMMLFNYWRTDVFLLFFFFIWKYEENNTNGLVNTLVLILNSNRLYSLYLRHLAAQSTAISPISINSDIIKPELSEECYKSSPRHVFIYQPAYDYKI